MSLGLGLERGWVTFGSFRNTNPSRPVYRRRKSVNQVESSMSPIRVSMLTLGRAELVLVLQAWPNSAVVRWLAKPLFEQG
jgi:hypothetical protein